MKKAGIILLLSIYSLSIFGVTLKEFYCCGKLKSLTVTISKDTEAGKGTDDGCCKTKYHSFKVKDNHVSAADVNLQDRDYVELFPVYAFFQVYPISSNLARTSANHDPPDNSS